MQARSPIRARPEVAATGMLCEASTTVLPSRPIHSQFQSQVEASAPHPCKPTELTPPDIQSSTHQADWMCTLLVLVAVPQAARTQLASQHAAADSSSEPEPQCVRSGMKMESVLMHDLRVHAQASAFGG